MRGALFLFIRGFIPAGGVPRALNAGKRSPKVRLFSQNSQLLLVSPIQTRPQLPFLHSTAGAKTSQNDLRSKLTAPLARFLTTERKVFLKQQVILGIKTIIILWTAVGLIYIMQIGIQMELVDRAYPSPPEWTFMTKQEWRWAKKAEEPNEQNGMVDWAVVGSHYVRLLTRLEDLALDGAGLQPILKDDGDGDVEDVGKAGLNIYAKSEPWRRAYHNSLMGMANAAENEDGWVKDRTINVCFPIDQVVGPSNLRPKRGPPGSPPAPLEENCEPVFEPPETYYMKILTTQGFTSDQRLDAALACANWLDFKGLSSTAEDMYDWALDIAMGALPHNIHNVVDIRTGIINSNADYMSSNILRATTALASHQAQNGNLAAALPVFLSVLRAQRQFAIHPHPAPVSEPRKDLMTTVMEFTKSAFSSPSYPPPPSSGDERPVRTPVTTCEEAGIMANIGEIIFASSTSESASKAATDSPIGKPIPTKATTGHLENQQIGLGWTRKAVDLAEATLESVAKDDDAARTKCAQCLTIGIENWSTMVKTMLRDEQGAKASLKKQAKRRWLWGSSEEVQQERWQEEDKVVGERAKKVRRLLLREEQRKQEKGFFAILLGS